MNSWFMWFIVLGWVVPFVLRRMSQSGQRGGRPPYPPGRRDEYGQYPGRSPQSGQYPGSQYPDAPPPQQLPESHTATPQDPPTLWWQQPLPPGFPGQPAPQDQPAPPRQAPGQAPQAASPDQSAWSPTLPGAPDDAPQGYRARKLAELDQKFSEQKISLEEYMKARSEIMRG
ncbi:hypothetical protein GCM10027449_12690 [Sinomonas notoginsengisoli]|uniref:hypothetical protein n=1 Tax=Sinomonas notoginsengisoli TaxID=1457311 RepID=UPI001F48E020|nr:hypothetical protein [Sinomonas notoginsengisoli]